MLLANDDEWDRYEARQWNAVDQWLRENSSDPDAAHLREWNAENRRASLTYGREFLRWGVFVLHRPAVRR